MSKKKRKQKKADKGTLAAAADRYDLYQRSVQEPEHEVVFFDQVFKEKFGRPPVSLREDFCGTFAVCCEWAKSHKDRWAVGVDLDPEPLDWGRAHNLSRLTENQQRRVTLRQDDVRTVDRKKVDVLAAQNFSFWIFKTRKEVLAYFRKARQNLAQDGLMIIDMMGGPECWTPQEDVRKIPKANKQRPGFNYVWEQHYFDAVTHDAVFHIHFRFKDGSKIKRAFTYEWRFWSIPEVRELLAEAGFRETHVYWEGTDENGEGDDNWQRAERAESEASWIAYVIAVK